MIRNLTFSLKPIWLLGLGTALGLLVLLLLWGIIALVHRRTAAEIRDVLFHTAVWPILAVAVVLTMLTALMSVADLFGMRFFDQKLAAIGSVVRLPYVGETARTIEIPADRRNEPIPLRVSTGELKRLSLEADHDLIITVNEPATKKLAQENRIVVVEGAPFEWARMQDVQGPLTGQIDVLYVSSKNDAPTKLSLIAETEILVPQARVVPVAAIGLVGLMSALVFLQIGLPKTAAIAFATAKETVSQPLFLLVLVIGAAMLFFLIFLPFFTFGEDYKMYKESGMTLIKLLAVLVALWTASISVAEEVEGRTALSVLSKPIARHQFVIGKYLGIVIGIVLLFVLLGTLFLFCTSYKVMYDARESGDAYMTWQDCHQEMFHTVPGLILACMEAAVLASVCVALSTRLSMVPNLLVCLSIYVLGHLVEPLLQSTVGKFEIVQFMGRLLALLLPVLEYYRIEAAVIVRQPVSVSYLGWMSVYSLIYVTIAMLLAQAMFVDRDLA